MSKFTFNKYFTLKLQYRTLHTKIMGYTEREGLYTFLEMVRANVLDQPFSFTEEAIEVFLQAWEDQHGKADNPSFLFPQTYKEEKEKDEEEEEKKLAVYTPEMCLILANSLLMMFRLYDQDETRKAIDVVKAEVQLISRDAHLITTRVAFKPEFRSERTYKKLLRLQTRAIAIIAHQRETEL
jgi:hypothetical protein